MNDDDYWEALKYPRVPVYSDPRVAAESKRLLTTRALEARITDALRDALVLSEGKGNTYAQTQLLVYTHELNFHYIEKYKLLPIIKCLRKLQKGVTTGGVNVIFKYTKGGLQIDITLHD